MDKCNKHTGSSIGRILNFPFKPLFTYRSVVYGTVLGGFCLLPALVYLRESSNICSLQISNNYGCHFNRFYGLKE